MERVIKFLFGISNATLAAITLALLFVQFSYSAIRAGQMEMAMQNRMSELSHKSFAELGRVKVGQDG